MQGAKFRVFLEFVFFFSRVMISYFNAQLLEFKIHVLDWWHSAFFLFLMLHWFIQWSTL